MTGASTVATPSLSKSRAPFAPATRGRSRTVRQEGKTWIYEDEVIGLPSFRSWILSYGSSVKVIEPASLAERILSSSRIRLLNYEDGGRFHDPASL